MLRHMEVVWQRRLAIALMLPVYLICGPFVSLGVHMGAAIKEYIHETPEVIRNCKDMWRKDFKACKRI